MTDMFICPVCKHPLKYSENLLLCTNTETKRQHSFNVASAGYTNLTPPSSRLSGDPREMVKARSEFLSAGYYEPISNALCRAITEYAPNSKLLLDAGCGEGYYTNRMATYADNCIGIDISKEAIISASKSARRHGISNISYAVASIFHIPVQNGVCDVITSLFAPCAEDEFLRLLKPGGIFACVCAAPRHLMGLKEFLYDKTYENTERADLPKSLELVEKRSVKYNISVNGSEHIYDLFTMTPYFYRTPKSATERLLKLEKLETSVETDIYIYKKS
jgi:23S rRNA (guanine745-N1)-methyltransferase